MKKIIFIIFLYLFNTSNIVLAELWNIEDDIIPDNNEENILIDKNEWWEELVFSLLEYWKDSIFGLLAIIAITVFIFIWARLVIARWNPEEFKKALMNFVYAIVWLAIVAISWAAVKLVSSINF